MSIHRDAPPNATGPLIREFRPHRRRAAPRPGWATYAAAVALCLALAVASIAGPVLHLLMR